MNSTPNMTVQDAERTRTAGRHVSSSFFTNPKFIHKMRGIPVDGIFSGQWDLCHVSVSRPCLHDSDWLAV